MNPTTKPADTRYRVIRGGGCHYFDAAGVRAAFRYWFAPPDRDDNLGFRCALRGREPRNGRP